MSKTICVYCASSNYMEEVYFESARIMGEAIATRGHTLLYGGGSIGLMGELARSVHAHGGRVIGVIPIRLMRKEIAYAEADELVVTEDLRARKKVLMERADAFVGLPGAFGTLEELSEALTHQHLGYHNKPVVLLNTAGFFDPLVALFDHFFQTRAAPERLRASYHVTTEPDDVFHFVESFDPNATYVKFTDPADVGSKARPG